MHIGEDIGTAKRVNRLFGIADQQQRMLRLLRVDFTEYTVLLRIGILEFIDQRNRKTAANGLRQ